MTGSRLANKVVIVTGAAADSRGAGMGRAIAERCGQEGAAVVAVDLSAAAAQTAERIQAAGGRAIAVRADVTSREDVARVVRQAVEQFGKVDGLVNVVGGALHEADFLDLA